MIEPFLKQDGFVLAGLIRQLHDTHLVAGLCAPLLPIEHDGSKAVRRRSPQLHGAGEIAPAAHAQPRQHGIISIERMAG
ncbi:MAG: hypothetical protein WDN29_14240 [Methylovirgula sp.]